VEETGIAESEAVEAETEKAIAGEGIALAEAGGEQADSLGGESSLPVVNGQILTELPQDLYIPPDALKVFLEEAFQGPLDLLLYLIKRQNLDIVNIPVAIITTQYVKYIEVMESLNLELAAEYLVMSAMLGEIKSRSLLPKQDTGDEDEDDPRNELIRRLQEYERFKQAAEAIDELPRMGRDVFSGSVAPPVYQREIKPPPVDLREVLLALRDVFHRADMFESHQISRERLSTRERMSLVLEKLKGKQFVPFISLFTLEEGRPGVIVTFLAVLELVKESLIELSQTEHSGAIHVKQRVSEGDPQEGQAKPLQAGGPSELEGDSAAVAGEEPVETLREDNVAVAEGDNLTVSEEGLPVVGASSALTVSDEHLDLVSEEGSVTMPPEEIGVG